MNLRKKAYIMTLKAGIAEAMLRRIPRRCPS